MPERVVVTGFGAITPLGANVEDTWQGLIDGRSGIDYISLFDADGFNVKIAAEVKDFNPAQFLDPTTAKYSDRFTQFAITASVQAIDNARLIIDETNKYDIGILVGSGIGGLGTLSKQFSILDKRGPDRVSPYIVPMMIADNASSRVSIRTRIMGPNLSLVSSCSTGTDSIGIAYKMIKHEEIKAMVVGGADAAITPIGVAGFRKLVPLPEILTPGRRQGHLIYAGMVLLSVKGPPSLFWKVSAMQNREAPQYWLK